MRSTAKHRKISFLERIGRKRALGIVVIIAAFTLLGGWLYVQASRAATVSEEVAVDERIQELTYDTVPGDLQTAIMATTKEQAPNCIKDEQIVDYYGLPVDLSVTYTEEGYAATTIGCNDMSELLLARTSDGTWEKVGSTQFEYKCADLSAYNVPVWFMQAIEPTEDVDDSTAASVTCIPDTPGATASVEYK